MTKKLSVNPWLEMWIRPRRTIRAIVQFNPNYMLFLLSVIYGFPLLLQIAQISSLGNSFSTAMIVGYTFLGSLILGFIAINLSAWVLNWTGQWLKGKGTFQQIRAALAWSSLPNLLAILLWIINIIPFGRSVFTQQFASLSYSNQDVPLSSLTALLQVIISIWGVVMVLKSLSEVQRFSVWKALLNMIILLLILSFLLFIVSWLIGLLGFENSYYPMN